MTFPFEALTTHSREAGLVAALLIGIGFGFVLERAGFGRATKLAAQFYLRDMTVFKVMFTAIVTAMLGLVAASGLGLASLREISESIASWTYLWPMLAGGLLLGAGFIVSGYCPGTSIVAAASGNVDGAVAFAGVVSGTFVYSELLRNEAFHRFHTSGDKGPWFLYDIVRVPPQLLAAAIAVMAVVAFVGAEIVEKMVAGREAGTANAATPRQRRVAFASIAVAAGAALLTIAVPASAPASTPKPASISATQLAQRLVAEPWGVRVIDVRSDAKGRISGSETAGADAVADIPDDGRTLVIVGDAKRWPGHARQLAGGYGAWASDPLARAMTTGAPPPPSPGATGGFAKPKKKGGGCSA